MLKNLEKIKIVLKLQKKCMKHEKSKKVKKAKNKCFKVSNNVQKLIKTFKRMKKVKRGPTDGRTDQPTYRVALVYSYEFICNNNLFNVDRNDFYINFRIVCENRIPLKCGTSQLLSPRLVL